MGQMLRRMYELESEVPYHGRSTRREVMLKQFPDLSQLPPELGLLVLSHLNATDLCLAACVWQNLGNDEILWHRYHFIIYLSPASLILCLANVLFIPRLTIEIEFKLIL